MEIKLTLEEVQALVNYFAGRPYAEAEKYVAFLRGKAQEAQEAQKKQELPEEKKKELKAVTNSK